MPGLTPAKYYGAKPKSGLFHISEVLIKDENRGGDGGH